MQIPETPPNETARLLMLHSLQILDTIPEERFDRLTRMTKRFFDVPIAVISLVDANRQWFKSCFGLSASETPRDISFCGHAILRDDVFIIPDALEDPRFADNPLVTGEPNIRFYAGCPLRIANSINVGTLCIIDNKPRSFNANDGKLLCDLADKVVDEFRVHRISTIDELTHISNKRGFLQIGNTTLKFCIDHSLAAFLVFIDLDNFKRINTAYGNAEGDRMLEEFAATLKVSFRGSDLIGRLGGEMFVVLVIGEDKENTDQFIHKVAEDIRVRYQNTDRPYIVEFSYDTVEVRRDRHASLDQVIAERDALMQTQKVAIR
ncbi:sensor domain-containing diguanylate cyclase [Chitinimonas sp. BJB300]|nr:diguanylate cyclase [Chitinimonas sp. BJB300]PHV10114.1 GGDEF domain-containing protein [Chitinimonas sp. BJB300]TSJ83233.1 diguanylate cyclase [Chitinimonas sp. BJB300]